MLERPHASTGEDQRCRDDDEAPSEGESDESGDHDASRGLTVLELGGPQNGMRFN